MENTFNEFIKDKTVEIEVRFGTYGVSFTPEIKKEQFDRAFIFLKNYYEHSIHLQKIENYKNIRKITENDKVTFSEKSKIKNIEDKEYGFRFSVSREKAVEGVSGKCDFFKTRERHSFVDSKKGIRFDLDISKVSENTIFSIEIEALQNCIFKNYKLAIDNMLKILQDTEYPISVSHSKLVLKHYFNLTKKSKFAGVQPKTLSDDKFEKKEKYAITKKLDGLRYNIVCYENNLYSVSSKLEVKWLPFSGCDPKIIFDVEYYKGYYHIFDIVSGFNGNLLQRLEKAFSILKEMRVFNESVKPIVMKEFSFSSNISDTYSNFKKLVSELDYNGVHDGLILVKQDQPYEKSDPLKWKPDSMNTIDFLIANKKDLTFELLVVNKEGELHPFAKTTVNEKDFNKFNNGDIVEFSYIQNVWVPVKPRPDKTKPNFIAVAEDNLHSVLNPFNPEETFSENPFFNMRRFHNFVKRTFINKYKGSSVLDLACGKGGDLGKYVEYGFTRVDGYDINKESIKEALSRSIKISKKSGTNVKINLEVKDLAKESVKSDVKFDLVVNNFAFHYFYKSLDVFIKSITPNLKKKGKLLLTLFDGKLVKSMKSKNFEIKEVGKDKISVFIKDSVLNKPEVEYIVDIDNLVKVLEENGLKLVKRIKFEDVLVKWEKLSNGNKLSPEEKKLSMLNVALVFELI